MKSLALTLFIIISISALNVSAQSTATLPTTKKENSKSGTYLKVGLAHWQENIFGPSLTQWRGNLFGSDYNLTSAGGEIESYFKYNHLGASGWAVGYRKDDLRYSHSGHMINIKSFRNFDAKFFEIKTGVGLEFGVPALSFDKTRFDYGENVIRYRHTYPSENVNIPFMGTSKDGAFYPFIELSAAKRKGRFIVEGGMRINVIRFGIDDYEIINDEIEYNFKNKEVPAPYLFINIGMKIFK